MTEEDEMAKGKSTKTAPNLAAKGSPLDGPVIAGKAQTQIPGTEPAAPPAEVEEAAEQARSAFLKWQKAQTKFEDARGHLQMLMEQHNVSRVVIVDDDGKRAELYLDAGKPTVKQRALDKAKAD